MSVPQVTHQHLAPTQIHPKVAAVGVGGAIASIVIFAASVFFHDDLTKYGPSIAAAASLLTTIVSVLSGYFKSS